MRLLSRIEFETTAARKRRFQQIDQVLDGGKLTKQDLLAIKDEMLALIVADKAMAFEAGSRIARVNAQSQSLNDQSALRDETDRRPDDDAGFQRLFFEAARRLLKPEVFEMLCRDADNRRNEINAIRVARATSIPLPPPDISPPTVSIERKTAKTATPLKAPVHRLVTEATNRPMKFDPTALFKEFGRERVLATWNMCTPETRPETAADFRRMLAVSSVKGFFEKKEEQD